MDDTYPNDVRLDLDAPQEEVVTEEASNEPTEVVEDTEKKTEDAPPVTPPSGKCENCNGTGLEDYQFGRSASKMCSNCNGSGLI